MQLVEEAVDGCWVGHRARQAIVGDTGIGSVYSPPEEEGAPLTMRSNHVETVIEIGHRQQVCSYPPKILAGSHLSSS